MQLTISGIPVILTCTPKGKQALKTETLTPRQRQFILLVEENTRLGEQAVSNLLTKLDLQELIKKGWISCDVPQVQIFKQPFAAAQLASELAVNSEIPVKIQDTTLVKKSFDKTQSVKGLKSFLNTYGSDDPQQSQAVKLPKVTLSQTQQSSKRSQASNRVKPELKIPEGLKPKTGQEPEDIMIVQSLLDD